MATIFTEESDIAHWARYKKKTPFFGTPCSSSSCFFLLAVSGVVPPERPHQDHCH